ncbi:MAG: hypothetical protein ACTSQP_18245 [Promethearchaeota archaeon]
MYIMLIIPPVLSTTTIIPWNQVNTLNYFRAFIFLIGLAYLPGSCIYNIFFYKDNIYETLKVNSYIFKITLYPLISFNFLGISVLILDQIGFIREMFPFFLFLIIIGLFLVDLIISTKRKKKLSFNFNIIKISKSNLLIFIFLIGFFFLSFGIQCSVQYLYVGDAWAATKSAFYIGRLNITFYEDTNYYHYYPFFWGYISFGLSVMSGLPYININTILIPFCYIYITSTYILIKTILEQFQEKYILLSTLFVLILQNYFYIFFLLYKAYSWSLLYICLAIFIGIIKRNENKISLNKDGKYLIKIKEFKMFILGVLFLIIGYMTYVYPLIIGPIFLFFYCFFSDKRKRPYFFKYFAYFVFLQISIFIFFDLLINFHLSRMFIKLFLGFFKIKLIESIFDLTLVPIMIYILSFAALLSILFFTYLFFKISKKDIKIRFKFKNSKMVWFLFLILILMFFFIIVISVFINFFLFDNYFNENYIFSYSDIIIICFGFVWFVLSFLVFYFLKKKKKIFYLSLLCIEISILVALFINFYEWITTFPISFEDVSKINPKYFYYWFSKISIYLCPLTGIFSSFFLILNANYICGSFLQCYLDIIFRSFGFIGIIAIFLSYYCYKRKKRLFYILLLWIFVPFLLGSILFYYNWISNFPLSPQEIPIYDFNYMINWFTKMIRYAYPSVSIIASIGIFEFVKKIKNKKILKSRKLLKFFIIYFIISVLLFPFISELIIRFNIRTNYTISDEEVRIISWASEKIPINSKIIISPGDTRLANGFKTMTYCNVYYFNDIFKKGRYNQTEFNEQIHNLKVNRYQYILISLYFLNEYLNSSSFIKEFYNNTLYQSGRYNLSYAPYFG